MRALLATRFVPAAIDSWYYRDRDDADGRFFQGFARPAALNPANPDGNRSLQGHYIVTASGRLLAAHNHRGPEALKRLLTEGLARLAADGPDANADAPAPATDGRSDRRFVRRLPPGGVVLNVHTRILGWDQALQTGLTPFHEGMMRWNATRAGVDHLWILPDEIAALIPDRPREGQTFDAPRALARRLARFHLTDNVRGEPPHFAAREVHRADLRLRIERVEGARVHLSARGRFATRSPDRAYPCGFDGSLEGQIVYDVERRAFDRFDLLAEGRFHGEGRWTPGAPKGTFRLAIAFELPRSSFAVDIPPQGIRDERAYLAP